MCVQFGILHQESRQCLQLTWVTVGTGVGDGVTTAASGAKVGSGVGLQEHTQYQASYLFICSGTSQTALHRHAIKKVHIFEVLGHDHGFLLQDLSLRHSWP